MTENEETPESTTRFGFDLDMGSQPWCIIEGQFNVTEDGKIHAKDAVFGPATKKVVSSEKKGDTADNDVAVAQMGHQAEIIKLGLGALLEGMRAAASFIDLYITGVSADKPNQETDVQPWTEKEKDYVDPPSDSSSEEE